MWGVSQFLVARGLNRSDAMLLAGGIGRSESLSLYVVARGLNRTDAMLLARGIGRFESLMRHLSIESCWLLVGC